MRITCDRLRRTDGWKGCCLSLVPWESFRKQDQLIYLAGALPLARTNEALQGHTKASQQLLGGSVVRGQEERKKGGEGGRRDGRRD